MSLAIPGPQEIAQAIRNVPDFPVAGVQFKDITPVLVDPRLFSAAVELMTAQWPAGSVDIVAAIEARGFILGGAAAIRLNAGFVPIRKAGKLPWKTIELSYELEYGTNTLAIHEDAIRPGQRVLLVDDVLATGGTAAAAAKMIERLGGRIIEIVFLIELRELKGRDRLAGYQVRSVVQL